MSSLYEQEIAKLDRHLDAGVITIDEYRDRVASAKAKHLGGTQPPTTSTTATAASAAPRPTAREMKQTTTKTAPKKKGVPWDDMPLPAPVDEKGRPNTESIGKITIRAIEGGKMAEVEEPILDKNGDETGKTKKAKKWIPNGQPSGKIAIGTGWGSELKLTYTQLLEFREKIDEIMLAVEGSDKENEETGEIEHTPGLLDDSQPRDILVL